MALTFIKTGLDVSCEKLQITATTTQPLTVDAVRMEVFVEGFNGNLGVNTLEHVKNIGSSDSFSFEVNDILKNFFEFNFYQFGVEFLTQKNVLATLKFNEVIAGVVQAASYYQYVNLKNFALDVFESDVFLTENGIDVYDCGDAGSINSKFLTSAPNNLKVNDFRNINLAVLKGSIGAVESVSKAYLSNITGVFQYFSLIDGLNGNLYAMPSGATQILKLNIATNAVTLIGTTTGGYYSSNLYNGKIYSIPLTGSNDVLIFDIASQIIGYITNVTTGDTNRAASCITSAGVIYSPPYVAPQSTILKIDTNTNIATEFGSLTQKYSAIFYASNNCSYAFGTTPNDDILKIDHNNLDATSFIHNQGDSAFNGSISPCVEVGGFLYAFSDKHLTNGTYVIFKIDLSDDSVTEIPFSSALNAFNSAALANNGLIYILREKQTQITVFNPATSGLSTFETLLANNSYAELVNASNGSLYALPTNTALNPQAIIKISFAYTYSAKQQWDLKVYDTANTLVDTINEDLEATERSYILGSSGIYDIHCLNYKVDSTNDANKVTVQIVDKVGGAARSELRTFYNANFDKSKIQGVTVSWMNEFGVQDSYTFAGEFNRQVKSDKDILKRVLPVNPTSTNVGQLAYNTMFNYEYELSTDRITQDTAIWLTKMLRSNKVAIHKFDESSSTPRYFPIILSTAEITDSSEFEKVTVLTIKFTLANERKGLI
jgi:hypothetical protein